VPIGPEFFPRYLAVGLFICSAILVIQALLAASKSPNGGKSATAAGDFSQKSPTISPFNKGILETFSKSLRLLAGIAIIVAYAVLWEPLGFVIATPLAMAALMFLLGYRRYVMMAIFAVGTTLVIFGAFSFFLNVNMPMGILH
jgi:putative tricarboxylic transport membrane protein